MTIDNDIWVNQAIKEVARFDGLSVSVAEERQSIIRLGRNLGMTADTQEIIWNVGVADEILPAAGTNPIDRLVSSSASDAETVLLLGHVSDAVGNKTFTVQTITLTGQTPVVLPIALHRVVDISRNATPPLVGDVYVYENSTVIAGVPQDLTKVHSKIDAALGFQRGNKAQITISSDVYFFVTSWSYAVTRQNAGYVDFTLEIKDLDGVFLEQAIGTGSRESGTHTTVFRPFIVMRPNADLVVRGTASASGTRATTQVNGIVASIRS